MPPLRQRARLARKWLYSHATYPHDVDTPSVAQLRNLGKIVALARDTPIHKATLRMMEKHRISVSLQIDDM